MKKFLLSMVLVLSMMGIANASFVVSEADMNIRSGPGMSYERVTVLKKADVVEVPEGNVIINDRWLRLGEDRYVHTRYLKIFGDIEEARSYRHKLTGVEAVKKVKGPDINELQNDIMALNDTVKTLSSNEEFFAEGLSSMTIERDDLINRVGVVLAENGNLQAELTATNQIVMGLIEATNQREAEFKSQVSELQVSNAIMAEEKAEAEQVANVIKDTYAIRIRVSNWVDNNLTQYSYIFRIAGFILILGVMAALYFKELLLAGIIAAISVCAIAIPTLSAGLFMIAASATMVIVTIRYLVLLTRHSVKAGLGVLGYFAFKSAAKNIGNLRRESPIYEGQKA